MVNLANFVDQLSTSIVPIFSVAHLEQGNVWCKIPQELIEYSKNLGGISKSEKVSFQMVMEKNDVFLWQGVSDSNWKKHDCQHEF